MARDDNRRGDQIRNGVERWNRDAGWIGEAQDGATPVRGTSAGTQVAINVAWASSRAGAAGRADSTTGHWSRSSEMAIASSAASGAGQCDVAAAGARQAASHHARAGATPPMAAIASTIRTRLIRTCSV
jgi:hypothetical protein